MCSFIRKSPWMFFYENYSFPIQISKINHEELNNIVMNEKKVKYGLDYIAFIIDLYELSFQFEIFENSNVVSIFSKHNQKKSPKINKIITDEKYVSEYKNAISIKKSDITFFDRLENFLKVHTKIFRKEFENINITSKLEDYINYSPGHGCIAVELKKNETKIKIYFRISFNYLDNFNAYVDAIIVEKIELESFLCYDKTKFIKCIDLSDDELNDRIHNFGIDNTYFDEIIPCNESHKLYNQCKNNKPIEKYYICNEMIIFLHNGRYKSGIPELFF